MDEGPTSVIELCNMGGRRQDVSGPLLPAKVTCNAKCLQIGSRYPLLKMYNP